MLRAILRFCDMAQFLVATRRSPQADSRDRSFGALRRMKSQMPNDRTEQIEELIGEVERDLDRLRPGREWGEEEGDEAREEEQPEERAEELMAEAHPAGTL